MAIVIHEFGHVLGFAQSACAGSVMSDTNRQSYRTTLSDCDRQSLQQLFPTRRDADGDGYSEDDPPYSQWWDCDDNDPAIGNVCAEDLCAQQNGFWDGTRCVPYEEWNTPLIVDTTGNGFRLTDAANGVRFDLNADGTRELLSWTQPGSDDAFLALDRNGNGTIDDGTELFSNFAPQPASAIPNGFAALAVFDANRDGWIDAADDVYGRLRLWTDTNHDGVSQSDELRGLAQAGFLRISLDVKESERRDRYGNSYRYRAKIVTAHPRDGGPFVYDVFLTVAPSSQNHSAVSPGRP